MNIAKQNFPYKVLNHNEIEEPKILDGNPYNIERTKYWIYIIFDKNTISFKTKLAIYNKEQNQTLELIEATLFAKLLGVQNLEYPLDPEHENHALFVSEIYLVHHTMMYFVLMSRKQNAPNTYDKFQLHSMNLCEIYHKLHEFEYYYNKS